MKKVYKCDFCMHTNEDKEEVRKHEFECCFNPRNRACFTCRNRDYSCCFNSAHEPSCALKADNDDFDGETCPYVENCVSWEPEI